MKCYHNPLMRLLTAGALCAGLLVPAMLQADFPAPEIVKDLSGNARDGLVLGFENGVLSENTPPAVAGSVSSIDLSNLSVDIVGFKGILGADSRTIAAWIYPREAENVFLIDWGRNNVNGERWIFRLENGHLRVQVDGGFVISSGQVTLNAWNHVALTFEGENVSDVTFYLNGVEQNNGTVNPQEVRSASSSDARIGRPQNRLDGLMDEFGIWSRALSAAEVQTLADGQLVSDVSEGLEVYYDFDFRLPEIALPYVARFGSARYLEMTDSLTYSEGKFEMLPIQKGSGLYVTSGITLADQSPNERAGTLVSIQGDLGTFSDNVPEVLSGSSFSYDFSSDAIDILGYDGVLGTDPRTFAAWIYPTGSSTNEELVVWGWTANAQNGEQLICKLDNGRLRVQVKGGFVIGETRVTADTWNHVGFTFEGDNVLDFKLYVNGVLQNYAGSNGQAINTAAVGKVRVGAPIMNTNQRVFRGSMDDFAMWSRALSEAEMASLAAGSSPLDFAENLDVHYDFEGGGLSDVAITSLPASLDGNFAIFGENRPTKIPSGDLAPYLGFAIDRPATVYVAYDTDATVPGWISNHYSPSGMEVGTTAGNFQLWEREFAAGEQVSLLFDNTVRNPDDNDYWVILSDGPEAITASPEADFVYLPFGSEAWTHERFRLTVTADPETASQSSSMVTRLNNLDPASGFRLETTIRPTRLPDASENAFGFQLLGGDGEGIRAEWLPREAGGGSRLALVDASTGSVLGEANWTGLAPAAIDNNVGIAGGGEVTFQPGSAVFSDSGPLFHEDFEDGAAGWTSESKSLTADQWEIGNPDGAGPGTAFSGQNVAGTGLGGGYDTLSHSLLRSPVVDLTDAESATLHFQEYLQVDTEMLPQGPYHYATVSVIDVDSTPEQITELARYNTDILEWTAREFDLSSYAGKRISLEFGFVSDQYMMGGYQGWFIDDVQVTSGSVSIVSLPAALTDDASLRGIATSSLALANTSESLLQFTVEDRAASGNDGVSVFVAWDVRASGLEPNWLRDNFTLTDHLVEMSQGAHRLWVREYGNGEQVVLGGASAPGGGPFLPETNNYFVLLGDARPGLDQTYTLAAEGILDDGTWNIEFSVSDDSGHSQTVSATIADDLSGRDEFGLFARHSAVADAAIWDVFEFSIASLEVVGLSGFAEWRGLHFPGQLDDPAISGPDAAPAGDGVANLMKYALDLSPWEPVSSADLPLMDLDGEGNLILAYWERKDIDDIEYIPEISQDLEQWSSGEPAVTELFREAGPEAHLEEVVVKGLLPEEAARGFIRLRVLQK